MTNLESIITPYLQYIANENRNETPIEGMKRILDEKKYWQSKYYKSIGNIQSKDNIRNQFACAALPSVLNVNSEEGDIDGSQEEIAELCYTIADAMIIAAQKD